MAALFLIFLASLGMTIIICILYLTAAASANVAVSIWGESAAYLCGLILIPFDLVTRDVLHERWRGNVWPRMVGLIFLGSLATALVAAEATDVAVASFIAFSASGITNALAYQKLIRRPKIFKMSASNLLAALVDSIIISALLFNFSVWFILGQTLIKFVGGYAWSLLAIRLKVVNK